MDADLVKITDRYYAEGCRDQKVEAIFALLDLVNNDDMDYVFREIEERIGKIKSRRYESEWKKRGW